MPITQSDYEVPEGLIDTGVMGGVPCPSAGQLTDMQHGQYVLHARGGKLREVPAEKIRLPHDPQAHPQGANITLLVDGTLYVRHSNVFLKSTDGGRTWTSHPHEPVAGLWRPLEDGGFIRIAKSESDPVLEPVRVFRSDDGRTWQPICEIEVPKAYHTIGVTGIPILRLPDGTLLFTIVARNQKHREDGLTIDYGTNTPLAYRSSDGGETWQGPSNSVCDYTGGEGGIVRTASGKLLAALRYQRGLIATESRDLIHKTGCIVPYGGVEKVMRIYKHVFLADSVDEGRTWRNQRQLTTVFGQCYGFPATLSDGTVVIVHDTRYGPGEQSSRAMISRDEGQTWQDEVYYVFAGKAATGYSQSVVFDDDTILTVGGFSDYTEGNSRQWTNWVGRTDMTAIRWRPVE